MKRPLIILNIIFLYLSLSFLVSCSYAEIEIPAATEAFSLTAVPVQATATLEPTATPTAEPTASPTARVLSQVEREQLNQRIQDFLNSKGEYTDEKLKEITMQKSASIGNIYAETKLGLVNIQGTLFDLEGVFLGFSPKDSSLLLLVGFLDNKEKRFVTAVEVACYYYEQWDDDGSYFNVFALHSMNVSFGGHREDTKGDVDSFSKYLTPFIGNAIVLIFDIQDLPAELLSSYEGEKDRFFQEINIKAPITKTLVNTVYSNGEGNVTNLLGPFEEKELVMINEDYDISNIDTACVPILFGGIMLFNPEK